MKINPFSRKEKKNFDCFFFPLRNSTGPKVLIPETYPGYFELLSEDGRSTRCIESVLDLSRKPNLRVLVRETFRCNQISKTIHAGEILTTMYENGKYLKCKTQKDEIINLPLEAKAKFSPFAKEDSISGVHTVKNLLKKRMPIVVRYLFIPVAIPVPFKYVYCNTLMSNLNVIDWFTVLHRKA